MTDKLKPIFVIAVAIAAVGLVGGAIAVAAGKGGEDNSKHITGKALVKARDVALSHAGGGRVTDTEVGDEEGYYEVEVSRGDGTKVDVHLDRNFHVVDSSPDGAGDAHGEGGG